jgi:hypothetical protein
LEQLLRAAYAGDVRDVEVIAQQQQEGRVADESARALDRVAVSARLLLNREVQAAQELGDAFRLNPRPVRALWAASRLARRASNWLRYLASSPGVQTTQISSMPAARASSAMIWITGLVNPSRSTTGSIAF